MNTVRQLGIGMTSQRTRSRMVDRLREQGIQDELVLSAMNVVPRHVFVEEAIAHLAYDDKSLPIGHGQTISQPYIVARMCELLRNGRQLGRVLEVGAGCGYQAAILSHLAHSVISLERISPLADKAINILKELDVTNVEIRHGDGNVGIPGKAPFDGIILAAAATHVPQQLKEQLATGGRMLLPLGSSEQRLVMIERNDQGFVETELEAVKFVPLLLGKA